MPVEQATELASQVTPDSVGSFFDTAISTVQQMNPSSGTWLAIGLAALVLARMIWKKYKSK